jgi:hypothetical protein
MVHAHPTGGNGVAWWLEQRRQAKANLLVAGLLDRGGAARPSSQTLKVENRAVA